MERALQRSLTAAWDTRSQLSLILPCSVPEPDNAVARADSDDYTVRHPAAADAGLVAEVLNSTLDFYRARIPAYWIVNVVDRWIEVYTLRAGTYGHRQYYQAGDAVPLVLDGVHAGDVPVSQTLG